MSMNNQEEPKCAISLNNTIPENQTKIGTQVGEQRMKITQKLKK